MTDVFDFVAGESALVISVPHDGRQLPHGQRARMSDAALELPDTDWHVARLYDFARGLGASMIVANYSRYVVDLNRPATDAALYEGQVATGLCPRRTFAGDPLYVEDAAVPTGEVADRIARFWRPYHDRLAQELATVRRRHGYALLWDAHSIASRVPRLFDGELPVLNLGTFDGRSCDPALATELMRVADASPYTAILNGRFKGGYITRHYGEPGHSVHAVQLELAQRAYMDENSGEWLENRVTALQTTLRKLLRAYVEAAAVQ